jgi:hypothetical protein
MILPVTLNDHSGLVAGEMTIRYDPARVEVVGVTPAKGLMGWHAASHAQAGRLRIAFAGVEVGMGAGDLLLVELRPLRRSNIEGDLLTLTKVVLNDGMIKATVQRSLPAAYTLSQNIPNPFNPETEIRYGLLEDGQVTVVVYDITGRMVSTRVDDWQPAGWYTVTWDGRDEEGEAIASGVYIYRLTAGRFTATKRMVLIR